MNHDVVAERLVAEHRQHLESEASAYRRLDRSPSKMRLLVAGLLIALAHRLAPPIKPAAPMAPNIA